MPRHVKDYNDSFEAWCLHNNPRLLKEWHPTKNGNISPSMILPRSEKNVWWVCEKGHEWVACPSNRVAGTGCPYCANRKVMTGFNDLKTTNPDIADEWHPTKNGNLSPDVISKGSHKQVWWLGKCGHEWKAAIYSRIDGRQCPICSGKQVLVGFNDLATTNPQLALKWHPTKNGDLKPTDVTRGSNKKAWWMCEKGHEWESVINGSGPCPYCSDNNKNQFSKKKE